MHSFEREVKLHVNGFYDISFECVPAAPAPEICKIARNTNFDLIILGSHQRPEKNLWAGLIMWE